ncbi:MAG: hypothetical protein RL641_553 [Candidatus Parcubacteria bacterium]|jgi:triosephosphate isomerase
MNTTYIIGNWKEYPESLKDASKIATALAKIQIKKAVEAVVCPPFPYLQTVGATIKKGKYALGAQDLSPMMVGAFTGEVSPKALASLGVKYTIVGHSERRAMGDSNELIFQKIKSALVAGIRPILCVGEKNRLDAVQSHAEVRDQIAILSELSKKDTAKIIIAYEPLWAIGAKQAATPEDAREMRIYIQKVLSDMIGEKEMKNVPVLYGGAVNTKNAKDFITLAGMHGLLIGRASIDPKSFISIIGCFN